ncbi:MAG: LytTR family DNA-binding domain-containing protein [Armatimonadota bacterium]|nr:LytTR family DNA-binding domain-containing protein [Armatimonadota bacterium]MDR7455253.1 LytTR family DNA-binding domain-containing protein [Armatimonadota bacterium]MDR7457447.1 LytTR family DNA-binding domain-containing protein [Armatimonadota bacterium]MDR7496562.1 LytTR family DNA-binding domain-containing protein [Armatimonadota bacterium]MDR7511785.1 LytTR family DNA-binding domain-containing protein [Armatimonadota bacterium]
MSAGGALRAVIADDEAGARAHLRALLAPLGVEAAAECAAGAEVLRAAGALRPDLVCLDVRLPDGDGIEVARRLPRALPVVFVTGYAEHAADAFALDAADYVLKPLSAARLREALRRVRRRLAGRPPAVARVFVPAGEMHRALAPERILYVEAQGGVAVIHADDAVHRVAGPLGRLEAALARCGFLRTHRAYLVNPRRVRALVSWSRHAHTLLLDDGQETHVPVAKTRLAAFRRQVIWIPRAGRPPGGAGAAGQGRDHERREPGAGPGDRRGTRR